MKTALPVVHFLAVVALLLTSAAGFADDTRDLSIDEDELIRVEIATIGVAAGGTPVVLLREPEGSQLLPIFIGRAQAGAIARGMRGGAMPRPMTHDLLDDVVRRLDARLVRVIVDDLKDNTFLGMLELEAEGRAERLRIDSRPSDAMALAVRTESAIYVTPTVMAAAETIEYRGLSNQPVTAAGITVNVVTPELREALQLPDRAGLLVSEVMGPAAEAGMAAGALLLAVDGETPDSPMDFLERVQEAEASIEIEFWQEGSEKTIEVPTDVPEPERGRMPEPGGGFDL